MKKSVKITLIVIIVVVAALCVSLFIWNHTTKAAIKENKRILLDAAVKEATLTIQNVKKPGNAKEEIPEVFAQQKYPESFDLRHVDTNGDGVFENYVTGVKFQNPFGTCWAFGSIAAAETSILYDKGQEAIVKAEDGSLKDAIDLSEHHTGWFAYTPIPEGDAQAGEGFYSQVEGVEKNSSLRMNSGLTSFAAASLFASGMGPMQEPDFDTAKEPESQLNYHGAKKLNKFNEKKGVYIYTADDDWSVDESLRFKQNYMLDDAYYLPSTVKIGENGEYDVSYADSAIKTYKEQLVNGRAIAISFSADSYSPDKTTKAAQYINCDTWAHYTYDHVTPNHVVCIVGWDDNYSKDNFLSEVQETYGKDKSPAFDAEGKPAMKSVNRPPKDGAWIVKNSWGALDSPSAGLVENNWGIDGTGYFYLSYYDQSLAEAECFDFDVTEELKSKLGKYVLEEHDYMPCENPHSIHSDFPVSEANVFAAEENEVLKAVSCVTTEPNEEVSFSIQLVSDASGTIRSKKIIDEFTETFPYPGLHVVFMPEPYTVQKGEKVAVCVTQKANDKYIICAKTEYNQKAYDAGYCSDSYAATAIVNPGESYIFLKDSNTWEDFSEIKNTLENLDGPTSFFTYDNFPIKLYASIVE